MTKKIAIVLVKEYFPSYDDYNEVQLIQSITDWEEVSDNDYEILRQAQNQFSYRIVEQPLDTPKFIAKTTADWKRIAKEEATRQKKLKEEAAKKALEKKLKKEQRAKETKRQLLARLKEELGEE